MSVLNVCTDEPVTAKNWPSVSDVLENRLLKLNQTKFKYVICNFTTNKCKQSMSQRPCSSLLI